MGRWSRIVLVGLCAVAMAPPSAHAQISGPHLVPPAPGELYPPVVSVLLRKYQEPATPWGAGHRGVDLAVTPGTTVLRAAIAGRLTTGVTVGNRYATIEPSNASIRVTLSYLETVTVPNNTNVVAGDSIAVAGLGHGDGEVSEHHVHLSVRLPDLIDPSGWRYVDPMPYLRRYLRRVRSSVTRAVG